MSAMTADPNTPLAATPLPCDEPDTLKFACPKCSKRVSAAVGHAGKVVSCPKCGVALLLQVTEAPTPLVVSAPPAVSATSSPPPAHAPQALRSTGQHRRQAQRPQRARLGIQPAKASSKAPLIVGLTVVVLAGLIIIGVFATGAQSKPSSGAHSNAEDTMPGGARSEAGAQDSIFGEHDQPSEEALDAEIASVAQKMHDELVAELDKALPKTFKLRTSADVKKYRADMRKMNQPLLDAILEAPKNDGQRMRSWLKDNQQLPAAERERILRQYINEYVGRVVK